MVIIKVIMALSGIFAAVLGCEFILTRAADLAAKKLEASAEARGRMIVGSALVSMAVALCCYKFVPNLWHATAIMIGVTVTLATVLVLIAEVAALGKTRRGQTQKLRK